MSKYNKGDKFIVEIKEVIKSDNGRLYRSDFKTLTFDDNGLDKLQKYEQPTISEDTLEMERMKALNEGRNEIWELAKKIIVDFRNKTGDEFLDIFGCYCTEVFVTHTPQEALAKLEAYEKEQATFKRGNIVLFVDTDELGIYIGQYADGTHAVVFNDCNIPQKVSTEEIRKTDKNIDIQSVLL